MDPTSIPVLAGQTLIAGFDGTQAPPAELRSALEKGHLAGAILFQRNVGSPEEVHGLLARLAEAAPADAPAALGVDQEGGRVSRLGPPIVQLAPMRTLGTIDDADLTRRAGVLLGRQLRALGFNLDFAPVMDVDTNPANPVIGDRSFGPSPRQVIRHGLAFATGLQEAGVAACAKHFPGHGDTDLDSHLALPRLPHDMQRLRAVELAPFAAARKRIAAVMTAHVVFEALDPGCPATLSHRALHDVLRGELRYDGAVISDDLDMKAVADHWEIGEAACRAVAAGCDIVLACGSLTRALQAHEALVHRAEDDAEFRRRLREAASHSLRLRRRIGHPTPSRALRAATPDLHDEAARALEAEIEAGARRRSDAS